MKKIDKKNIIKIAAVILIIIAAFVFFGDYGEKEEIPIETETIIEKTENNNTEPPAELYVDISGQVKKPGVYSVSDGTRLFQLIELAGGLKSSADFNGFNQAEALVDGQKIIIPKKGEETTSSGYTESQSGSKLININNGDNTALQQIPGVGPATAEKIIIYRNENGKFKTKEDIKNVSGIGEKTYEKMKDSITV